MPSGIQHFFLLIVFILCSKKLSDSPTDSILISFFCALSSSLHETCHKLFMKSEVVCYCA